MAFEEQKYGIDEFSKGRVMVCSQKAEGVDDAEVKTLPLVLARWAKHNLKIYVLNVGDTNPLTECTIYGGFAEEIGDAEEISAQIFDISNFFNKSADPGALAHGEAAMLVCNQDGLPRSIQVGVKGGSGAATDVLVIFEVAKRPEA